MFDACITHLKLQVPSDMRDDLFAHGQYFVRASEMMRQTPLVADEPSNVFDPLQYVSHGHVP